MIVVRSPWRRLLTAVLLMGVLGESGTAWAVEGAPTDVAGGPSGDPAAIVRSAADEHFELLLKYRASAERPTRATFSLSDFATKDRKSVV